MKISLWKTFKPPFLPVFTTSILEYGVKKPDVLGDDKQCTYVYENKTICKSVGRHAIQFCLLKLGGDFDFQIKDNSKASQVRMGLIPAYVFRLQ